LGFEDGVEEPGLVEIVDGLGFVEGGKFGDLDVGVAEESECVAEIFFAVADIGA
jgi:hypothetical protein